MAAEQRPDVFVRRHYAAQLEQARRALAALVHVPPDELVLVPNATTAVNTVLRGLRWAPGDAVVHFDFVYGGCAAAIACLAESAGVATVCVPVALPAVSDVVLVDALRAAVVRATTERGLRVRLALFDTVAAQPAVRLPFEALVAACHAMHVLSFVDAAHGVGLLPLRLHTLGADFVTSNCHKWLFVPRGCAMLHVPRRNQHLVRSALPASWGFIPALASRPSGSRSPQPECASSAWTDQFTHVGSTADISSYLTVPAAIAWRRWLGGEDAIIAYTCRIARLGASVFARRLGTEVMAGGVGMHNIRLPLSRGGRDVGEEENSRNAYTDGPSGDVPSTRVGELASWMQNTMLDHSHTFVTVFDYRGHWWCRVSGQVYLEEADFERGADIVAILVERVKRGDW